MDGDIYFNQIRKFKKHHLCGQNPKPIGQDDNNEEDSHPQFDL